MSSERTGNLDGPVALGFSLREEPDGEEDEEEEENDDRRKRDDDNEEGDDGYSVRSAS